MTEFGCLVFAVIGVFIVDALVFSRDPGILLAGLMLVAVIAFLLRRDRRESASRRP